MHSKSWEMTRSPPSITVYEVSYDFRHQNGGLQEKGEAGGRGHMTETPKTLTYTSVVSRETVRIALMVAALNDLEVKTSDVQNAYLTAPCAEVIHTTLGTEFGEDEGKTAIIVRALYSLASAGASFRNHLADCMRHLGVHIMPRRPRPMVQANGEA